MSRKDLKVNIEFIIFVIAFIIGIISLYPSFINKYIIDDDVRLYISWMQQFRNRSLFNNDLLTEYAKNYQPWGFTALYYAFSFIIDPMIFSKIVPLVLFPISALLLYKLVKAITNNYTGFLAASVFMVMPFFLDRMFGGEPRAFGDPLLILFLYYLIRKEYHKSFFVLVFQSLFHPAVFFICILTYLFISIKIQFGRFFFDKAIIKNRYFIIMATLCFFIIVSKYLFINYNPRIGTLVTRKQMVGNPEYYATGRHALLPRPPISKEISSQLAIGMVFSKILKKPIELISQKTNIFGNQLFFLIAILFLISETMKKRLKFPIPLLLLFIASVLMYFFADLFLLKLFLPSRYFIYSLPLISLIISSLAMGQLILKINEARIKKTVQIAILILVFLNIGSIYRPGLDDQADVAEIEHLCNYLSSLPEETVIAAHPYVADWIPTFAQKKVFINFELSHCFFNNYWHIIKKRTFDFFNAYYSDNPLFIYDFCKKNGIDYLVVDKKHFTPEYFRQNSVYFEPFNTYIKNIAKGRKSFVLDNIPEEKKLFATNDIFVIKNDVLQGNVSKN